jgi:hypothetical protein
MNGTEQRNHKTALKNLEETVVRRFESLVDAMDGRFTVEAAHAAALIEKEAADRQLAHLATNVSISVNRTLLDGLVAEVRTFRHRGFWGRLNWMITGR